MVVVQKFPWAFSFMAVTDRQSELGVQLCKYNNVVKLWLYVQQIQQNLLDIITKMK